MQAQLKYVTDAMMAPNVTVQIIPYDAGAHPALGSTFNILEFAGPTPDLVYSEGLTGFTFIDRAEDVEWAKHIFDSLAEKALTPELSYDLLMKVGRSYPKTLRSAS